MALIEVGRFASLQEAFVARSALESAGLHPIVFDEFRASALWTEQFALGGIRLMAPAEEGALASEILTAARPSTTLPPSPRPSLGGAVSLLGTMTATAVVGWPLAGFRRPNPVYRFAALLLTFLAMAIAGAILAERLALRR